MTSLRPCGPDCVLTDSGDLRPLGVSARADGAWISGDKVVRRIADSFSLPQIYIFHPSGLILYSTVREHVGLKVPKENTAFWAAAAGQTQSVEG